MDVYQVVKRVYLKAPLSQVWNAIARPEEFGAWFGMKIDGGFVQGQKVTGRIVPTQVDPVVAEMQKPHEGKRVEFEIEQMDPNHKFSFRWHPLAVDPKVDYSREPSTLVTFILEDHEGAVSLTVTERGFDQLPEDRRGAALAANDGGWSKQMELITKYLARPVAS